MRILTVSTRADRNCSRGYPLQCVPPQCSANEVKKTLSYKRFSNKVDEKLAELPREQETETQGIDWFSGTSKVADFKIRYKKSSGYVWWVPRLV